MWESSIGFKSSAWLWLLALLPVLWLFSWHSLRALGPLRRGLALLLRSAVFVGLVLALAEIQWVRTSNDLTVYFLLDQSRSIPEVQRRAMADYVNRLASEHRTEGDRVGVIVFGERAAVEVPAFDADPQLRGAPDAMRGVSSDQTDIASAIRLAIGSFGSGTAKRVVVVTDANQTRGNALEAARMAAAENVGIDVVPIVYEYPGEVLVESVTVPPDVRREEPFELRVVLNNTSPNTEVPGRLLIYSVAGGRKQVVFTDESLQRITVPPGKMARSFPLNIDVPDFYRFEAEFVADDPAADPIVQNNSGRVFVHVAGTARILIIENDEDEYRGEHDAFAEVLRQEGMEIDIRPASQAFESLADLQAYDSIVLADVPRRQIDDERVRMIVQNTQSTGGGLLVLGGPNSYGAGGWDESPLEEALPVDFHIKNIQTMPTGALALVIDCSGSMSGDKLEMAKAAAAASADILSPRDFLSVTAFDSQAHVIVPLTRAESPQTLKRQISRISEGGGTDMTPGMLVGYRDLLRCREASVRHMIVLTDGHTPPGDHVKQAADMLRSNGITTSTIAMGSDADTALLQRVATAGGGKFYQVSNPRNLPRIFTKEAEVVTRSPIYRSERGFTPQAVRLTEALSGIGLPVPPITGYVMTTLKDSPLVEVALVAPEPTGEATERNRTILAQWRFGIGRAVALTTDVGQRWSNNWTGWEGYNKFFSQLIRSTMRPTSPGGQFLVDTQLRDGEVSIVVTALGEDNQFLNFQSMAATVSGPGREKGELVTIQQQAPGRYVGKFQAGEIGTYLVTLLPGADAAPIRLGVDIPYSDEYRVRETNVPLLRALADLQVGNRKAGVMIDASADPKSLDPGATPFRRDLPPAEDRQPAWPWIAAVAACLFFFDIANRRIAVSFHWVPELYRMTRQRLFARTPAAKNDYLERLRAKKDETKERYATAPEVSGRRFEARGDTVAGNETEATGPVVAPPAARPTPPRSGGMKNDEPQEPVSYADRLLKAKKRVWEDRDKGGTKPE